jgi:hypothetical protein
MRFIKRVLGLVVALLLASSVPLEAAARYWVGGGASANWAATGNTNWGTASNTQDNASVPGASDEVIFDGVGTGASNSTIGANITVRSANFTGYINTLTHAAGVTLSIGDATAGTGNVALKLAAGMTYTLGSSSTSQVQFISSSATQQTVNTGGKTMPLVTFNGNGGSWVLDAAFTASSGGGLTISRGTFDTSAANSYAITTGNFAITSANTKVVTLNASVITINFASTSGYTGSNATITAGTSTVKFTYTGAGGWTGGGATWYDLWLSKGTGTGTFTVGSSSTYHDLKDDGTGTHTITFPASGTNHVSTWTVNGTAGHLVTVAAASGTTTLTGDVAGNLCGDYLTPTNITANGSGVTWYAGANGTDGGGNTGWTFSACGGGAPAATKTRLLLGVGGPHS